MRFEHIEWNLSTATCAVLQEIIEAGLRAMPAEFVRPRDELTNCANELRSRLQRTDQDPHATAPPDPLLE